MQDQDLVRNEDGEVIAKLEPVENGRGDYTVPVFGGKPLLRVGFRQYVPTRHMGNGDYVLDARPICWPIAHPYWLVASNEDHNVIMAYVDSLDALRELWPEATDIAVYEENVEVYNFNSRFSEPDWLSTVQSPDFKVEPRKVGVMHTYVNDDKATGIILASEDLDYTTQFTNNRLEYGMFEGDFQTVYDGLPNGWRDTTTEYHITADLESAKKKAKELIDFYANDTGIVTSLHF